MRLALHTDYALRTLLYLALKGGRASAGDVADFYQISREHLAKVVQTLVRLGYVRSIRGVGGGVELRRSPTDMTLGRLILDLEGNLHLLECVATDNVCVIQPGCRLRTVLQHAEQLQLDYLNSVRLADLLPPGGGLLALERTLPALAPAPPADKPAPAPPLRTP